MATAVKLRLNIYPSLRRHPWRVLVGLLVLAAAAGAGAYFLVFYRHFRAAERAIARYDFDEAQEHLAACIRAEEGVATYIPFWPRRADLYLLAARTARRAERFPEAAAHLGEYERLQGKTSEQLLEHSMLRVQQGDLKENGIYLVKLLREDPPQTTLILEALAQGTYHVYLLSAAKRYAEKVLEREPDNVLMLLLLGIMLDGWHNVSEAEQYFRAAVNAQPGHAQARLELAQFLLRQRRYAEAAGHLEQLRERHYRPAAVLMGLALCRRQEGQTQKERELLDTLLAEYPETADALAERGRLELEAGELA
ncbi:MAG TPA: tetratricopeptide repeat protein, partial [Gemmataceae bacterium]